MYSIILARSPVLRGLPQRAGAGLATTIFHTKNCQTKIFESEL